MPTVKEALLAILKGTPASSHGRGQRSKRSQAARAQMASKMSAGVRVKKKVQSGRRFPKTDIDMATEAHPFGPASVVRSFEWAGFFIRCLSMIISDSKLSEWLECLDWYLVSFFSGVGCAESACYALVSAVTEFLGKPAEWQPVLSGWTVEIDRNCQRVLRRTYGRCNCADVFSFDPCSEYNQCTTHNRQCPTAPARAHLMQKRLRVAVAGGPCQPFSMMGARRQTSDVKFRTHEAFYTVAPRCSDILVFENVAEYHEAYAVARLPAEWICQSVKLDPRVLGLGASRARIYILAYNSSHVRQRHGAPSLREAVEACRARPRLRVDNYFWKTLPSQALTFSDEQNLREYEEEKPRTRVPDLSQLARNGRGRGETVDGFLPTLTTSSGKLWHKEKRRFLDAEEMLVSQCIPTRAEHERKTGAPALKVHGLPARVVQKMAGNAMSVPCVGCVLLAAMISLERY